MSKQTNNYGKKRSHGTYREIRHPTSPKVLSQLSKNKRNSSYTGV